ncbi:hypothetical protein JAAARDRAFT_490391 [Jaapia argillacea MUCL 33604]|uniref:Uncharacterized protein n=1 Tax=Jaapia argillacea MUCL 33604 TaxID=933084 RepID=A0A067PP70_9AGAM|nr:hypothetical protein JAAARDRAFT_490391 [Jaapia argillacea MUCL 33604]
MVAVMIAEHSRGSLKRPLTYRSSSWSSRIHCRCSFANRKHRQRCFSANKIGVSRGRMSTVRWLFCIKFIKSKAVSRSLNPSVLRITRGHSISPTDPSTLRMLPASNPSRRIAPSTTQRHIPDAREGRPKTWECTLDIVD